MQRYDEQVQTAAPASWMRIAFRAPGFFINDPTMIVKVNGWSAYAGSMLSGFDVSFPVVPGPCHLLVTTLGGPIQRERRYIVTAVHGYVIEVWLEYSRIWGNFTGQPRIVPMPLPSAQPFR